MHNTSDRSLIIGTYMTDPSDDVIGEDGKVKAGSFYYSGMRPGRIDEIIVIPFPDKENRHLILSCYLKEELITDEILEATKGMTGAYLKEFSTRLLAHGFNSWEREIESIRASLPVSYDSNDNNLDEEFSDE